MSTTIATGKTPSLVCAAHGWRYIYWIDASGSPVLVKGQIRDAQNAVVEAAFTAVSGVDDSGVAADESVDSSGAHRIVLLCVVSGSITQYTSLDGKVFT